MSHTADIPLHADMSALSQTNENIVDRAALSADKAIDATRRATTAAIDSVADTVHGLQDLASPALNRLVSPYESVVRHTREAPVKSLLTAAAAGAAVMAVLVLIGRSPRH